MNAICPNCNGLLETKPARKKKCPHCGKFIYVRRGQLFGEDQPIIKVTKTSAKTPKTKTRTKNKSNPLATVLVSILAVLFLCCGILVISGQQNQNSTSNFPKTKELPTPKVRVNRFPEVTPTKSKPADNLTPATKKPTITPPDTPIATSTPFLTPTLAPLVEAERDVNLRSGPGTVYEVIGALSPGQSFNIIGRNVDSSWWQIAVNGKPVWVAASVVKAVNTNQEIEIVEAPPPPVPTLAPTQPPTVTPTSTVIVTLPTPAVAPDAPPAGASAKCRDGTYSYSANRRGTCSHHGGVAIWY